MNDNYNVMMMQIRTTQFLSFLKSENFRKLNQPEVNVTSKLTIIVK